MTEARISFSHLWKVIGPIVLSACSIFITFQFIQPIALSFDPNFSLLASRSVGKFVFSALVIFHLFLFVGCLHASFADRFLKSSVLFYRETGWLKTMFSYGTLFFAIHFLILGGFYIAGYVVYDPLWGTISLSLVLKMLLGLLVTYGLAWSEELIFRGMVYQFIAQYWTPMISVISAAFIFMGAHDILNPLNLVGKDWRLGLGLFLLGMLLTVVFAITKKLYVGMGIHMGLVFVKVVLRRARFLVFIPQAEWHPLIHSDLRQAPLTHLLFIITIGILIAYNKEVFFPTRAPKQSPLSQ